ncbi:DNA cytosine methyltransferase [Streptomyces asiaticus]|nr:DNA cytosine methyltransferase [Streptomyces asiaticus]
MTDLFCGAGGSSTGAIQIPGVEVIMAANHSRHAIDTHQANHPDTRHDCADISQVVPTRYPRTDILWASPECTNHSGAKGVKRDHGEWDDGLFAPDGTDEAAIRSRATMWDVVRFAEAHQYPIIIVENVVENRWWGPKVRPGAVHDAWLASVKAWGYEHRTVYLNSMFAAALGDGAAQNRDRKYDVFWQEGNRAPDFDKWLRPWAQCALHGWVRAMQGWKTTAKCSPLKPWGRYGALRQYVWRCPRIECRNAVIEPVVRPASEIVDWGLPAVAIQERAERGLDPLEPATMRRIRAGFEAFGKPFLVPVEGRDGKQPISIDGPMRTCSTRNETGVTVVPDYIVELRGGSSSHRAVTEPLAAVCAGGNHHGPVYGGTVRRAEELRFRMLEPHEYQAAMEFPKEYVLTPRDKRTKVKMLGNAVTPNAARDLVAMAVESLTGEALEPAGPPIALEAAA